LARDRIEAVVDVDGPRAQTVAGEVAVVELDVDDDAGRELARGAVVAAEDPVARGGPRHDLAVEGVADVLGLVDVPHGHHGVLGRRQVSAVHVLAVPGVHMGLVGFGAEGEHLVLAGDVDGDVDALQTCRRAVRGDRNGDGATPHASRHPVR